MANENRSINLHWRRASGDGGLRPDSRSSPNQRDPEEKQLKSVWDCGSSLYDSFELYTFSQQLKSAIAEGSSSFIMEDDHRNSGEFRSLSMPHYVYRGRSSTCELEKACVVEEEQQHMERFTHNLQSDLLPLPRTLSKLGIPLLVKRLLNRAFHGRRNKL